MISIERLQMPDEIQAENEVVVETPAESPTVETETPEVAENTETESPAESQEQPQEEIIKKKSAEGRIRQLNADLKAERERRKSLEESVRTVHKEHEENPFSPENNPLPGIGFARPNENGEITQEQYNLDVQRTAKTAVEAVLIKQQQKQEAAKAMELYPQLNPENADVFDPDLSDAITEAVEAKTRLNPRASILETVEKLMRPYKKVAENAISSHQQELAGQVARAGIRPTQNTAPVKTKSVEEMTEAEIEAQYGKVYG